MHKLQGLLRPADGQPFRTRYAPSPTGYLHLGHVVNALYVWGMARALDGQVVLRLENHDRSRCKPAYEAALLEDLELLGFEPDLGAIGAFREGASDYRQSDCGAHYAHALEVLRVQGLAYACDCSRKRILARHAQPEAEELHYDGFCRERGLPLDAGHTIRFRMVQGEVHFRDLLLEELTQDPADQVGDFAIRDNHGNWTYQFAVVVDDMRHGVNLVVRGMDILSSTGRQIRLMRALGHEGQPQYLHHGLLVDATGRKLSKRDFAADIHHRLLGGEPPEAILGEAAYLVGWIGKNEPAGLEALMKMFAKNLKF